MMLHISIIKLWNKYVECHQKINIYTYIEGEREREKEYMQVLSNIIYMLSEHKQRARVHLL